ncbi:hypothetical protein D3C72_1868760 [compost metagenome]
MRIQQSHQRLRGRHGCCNQPVVPLGRWGAYPLHKGIAPGRVQGGLLPVHPLLGHKALTQGFRVQLAWRVPRAQVAHDGVGFPQHSAGLVVFHQRHQAIGIALQIVGLAHQPELAARVGALHRDAEFLRSPHHLAHVDGRQAPPEPQHTFSPCGRGWPLPAQQCRSQSVRPWK